MYIKVPANQIDYMTQVESQIALKRGDRVRFHFRNQSMEIDLDTTLEDLRWGLMARMTLTASDIKETAYSIIVEYRFETETTNFQLVKNRIKTFEIIENAEHLHVGDVLVYFEKIHGELTGNTFEKEITFITAHAQQAHFVVFGIV